MTQALAPLGSVGPLLVALVLISLGIGLPILIVLAIRLLWDRQLSLGRSRELDKLVWQLHRVASALEAAQQAANQTQQATAVPIQQPAVAQVATQRPAAAPAAQTVASPSAVVQAPVAVNLTSPAPAAPAPGAPAGTEQPTKAGVNSMFGF
jgi:cytoskeletal protein RodZ